MDRARDEMRNAEHDLWAVLRTPRWADCLQTWLASPGGQLATFDPPLACVNQYSRARIQDAACFLRLLRLRVPVTLPIEVWEAVTKLVLEEDAIL
eukprot:CAMPEP_0206047270 /NCGR_PEP_ID=MMETSP1466-20131121/20824_1 /ASSEMBLY_ACC=CAM_ASM_001126 /TAXON_ID=44452 /ORGANISM="Pavlova gyrans, Strain CCMP608" /LENGTH=94 /DNA_ID=CAMNT_0053422281 /DNA_START=138 /DNA_END=422 /DNA_ORIENTATION=+